MCIEKESSFGRDSSREYLRNILLVRLTILAIFFGMLSRVLFGAESTETDGGGHITVRLMDASNGKPLKGVSLGFEFTTETGRALKFWNAVTNTEGRVVISLPEPVPERIVISYSPNEVGSCSDVDFLIARVLKAGIVAEYKCNDDKTKWPSKATPGELVLFARRVSLWERIKREIP
jgi:hypothetical protein